MPPFAAGIDVGTRFVHLVAVDQALRVVLARAVPVAGAARLLALVGPSAWVGIDAPEAQRPPRHRDDPALSPKFRTARCGEIALGLQRRHWVPWVTPAPGQPVPGWMDAGFEIWRSVARAGQRGLEVYPHAVFVTLNQGGRLAKKRTASGRRQRACLLRSNGLDAPDFEEWCHDALDAAAAAWVGWAARLGRAEEVRCPLHTEAGIWLPSAVRPTEPGD